MGPGERSRPFPGTRKGLLCQRGPGGFVLFYPTSRSLYLDRGVQMRGNGVPVEITIPWTPEHLKRDVMLDTVLDLIHRDRTA